MIKAFKPADWSHSTNIYEVNIRQYSVEGNFKAFSKALPRLRKMGVETLWFMPVYPIGVQKRLGSLGSYYSIKDYKAVNPEFGTLNDFKSLVKKAKHAGFKIIIDWVANHTAWDHVWTLEHPEYFERDANGNFLSPFDWKDVIQINHKNVAQEEAMIDAMEFWITECNIDGFRCDMAHLTPLGFWKKARTRLDAIKPLFWLGEYDELEFPDYIEAFDASYSWTWMHQSQAFYEKKVPLGKLFEVLKNYDDMGDNSMRAWFTTNHDENSWNGTEFEKYGNMAMALAVFSATWNGIPLLYSGQEAMNKKRLKFFDKDPIDWPKDLPLQNFYKTLLNLHSIKKSDQ